MRRRYQNPKSVPVYVPSGQASNYAPVRKRLREMTFDEQVNHLRSLHQKVTSKKARTQNYLDRRRNQGVRTPTDIQFEQDQQTHDEILELLEELIDEAEQQGSQP